MSARPRLRLFQRASYVCKSCRDRILARSTALRPVATAQRRWITQNHIRRIKAAEEEWTQRASDIESGHKMSILDFLEERGFVNQIVGPRNDLNHLLTYRRVGVYVGIDPTAPSMHVGHMVPFMALSWMYVHGYGAHFLLGGFTSRIGDPTGRLSGREAQGRPNQLANMTAMHMQLKRFGASMERYAQRRGYMTEWAWKRALINNSTWWNRTTLMEFMRLLGSGMRIGPMLGRDTVKNRLEKGDGMSFAEFSYPLIQAWDWWQLYQTGVQVQIGGSDQFGCKATPSLIERMCRVLVGTGFLDQTRSDGGDYKHTKFSLGYRDVNVPSPGTFFQAMSDVYLQTVLPLHTLIEKKFDGTYREPSSNFDSPFVHYYGTEGQSTWDVMASIPHIMKTFQISLKAMDIMMPPTGPFYDFSQFKATEDDPDRIQIVDVGGGYGKVLRDIVTATPELDAKKCVLQDVAGVIGIADEAKEFGLQTQVIDFHTEQPVKGAKAYYMRFISHDYSDPDAINILSHVAKAMAPDSKLLFADCVIPQRLHEATLTAGALDQLMFCIGGKERTKEGFEIILGANGLELLSINMVPGSTGAIVEARLKAQ